MSSTPMTSTSTRTTTATSTVPLVYFRKLALITWGISAAGMVSYVTLGTTVVWELSLDGAPHTVTSIASPPLFDSGYIVPQSRFNYTFSEL